MSKVDIWGAKLPIGQFEKRRDFEEEFLLPQNVYAIQLTIGLTPSPKRDDPIEETAAGETFSPPERCFPIVEDTQTWIPRTVVGFENPLRRPETRKKHLGKGGHHGDDGVQHENMFSWEQFRDDLRDAARIIRNRAGKDEMTRLYVQGLQLCELPEEYRKDKIRARPEEERGEIWSNFHSSNDRCGIAYFKKASGLDRMVVTREAKEKNGTASEFSPGGTVIPVVLEWVAEVFANRGTPSSKNWFWTKDQAEKRDRGDLIPRLWTLGEVNKDSAKFRQIAVEEGVLFDRFEENLPALAEEARMGRTIVMPVEAEVKHTSKGERRIKELERKY